jgi:hypothetical protein
MDTINAAKNYASGIVSDASNELKSYSDDKDVALRSAMEEYTDTQVSAKADKSYVDAVKDELNSNIDSSVAEEAAAREGKDSELEGLISSLGSQEQTDVHPLRSARCGLLLVTSDRGTSARSPLVFRRSRSNSASHTVSSLNVKRRPCDSRLCLVCFFLAFSYGVGIFKRK